MKAENQRHILALAIAQAILGSQMPMYIILGGLVGQSLASNVCYATLPISLLIVGSMVSSPILSNLMQSTTRRLGLVVGNLAGLIGSLTSLLGIFLGSFEFFYEALLFQVRIWLHRHFIGLQLQMIVKTGSKPVSYTHLRAHETV